MNIEWISHTVRSILQRYGYDLVKFRSLNTILSHHGINVVFDVGANVGQYATRLRELGYRGKIVSFEPQQAPFEALSRLASGDAGWTAVHSGLGSADGQTNINVYSDPALSSMLTLDSPSFDFHAQKSGTETIQIRTVDRIIDQYTQPADRILLKIDTQGFEKEVLRGAEASFSRLVGIQIEMSLTPIYAEQPLLEEMVALLRSKGFMLWQIQRGLCKMESGRELEADGIFIHRKYAD